MINNVRCIKNYYIPPNMHFVYIEYTYTKSTHNITRMTHSRHTKPARTERRTSSQTVRLYIIDNKTGSHKSTGSTNYNISSYHKCIYIYTRTQSQPHINHRGARIPNPQGLFFARHSKLKTHHNNNANPIISPSRSSTSENVYIYAFWRHNVRDDADLMSGTPRIHPLPHV